MHAQGTQSTCLWLAASRLQLTPLLVCRLPTIARGTSQHRSAYTPGWSRGSPPSRQPSYTRHGSTARSGGDFGPDVDVNEVSTEANGARDAPGGATFVTIS